MNTSIDTLRRQARWWRRLLAWRTRRFLRTLRRRRTSPFPAVSLGLFPFVLAMLASAALVTERTGGRAEAEVVLAGPTVAESGLEGYRIRHDALVADYARRYRVPFRLAGLIYDASQDERIAADLAFRLVRTESRFRTRAVGPAGSVGLAQVKPSTARWLDSTVTRERLFEADTNLRLGFRYLRLLLDLYDHDTRLALLAYNRGPGTVAALLALGEDPGNGYASRVLGIPRPRPETPPEEPDPDRAEAGERPGSR